MKLLSHDEIDEYRAMYLASPRSHGKNTINTLCNMAEAHRAAVEAGSGGALTFDEFRHANVTRCVKWHPKGMDSWSPSDWLTAVTGELGELASLLKMRNRERDGLPGNKFSPTDKQIADELADVLTYLDLLAAVLGVNLGRAAAEKFNEISDRVGFPDRIATRASLAMWVVVDAELLEEFIEAVGALTDGEQQLSCIPSGSERDELQRVYDKSQGDISMPFSGSMERKV